MRRPGIAGSRSSTSRCPRPAPAAAREGAADLRRLPAARSTPGSIARPGTPIGLPSDAPGAALQLEWCAPFSGTRPAGAPRAEVRRRAAARGAARRGGRATLAAGRRRRRRPRPGAGPRERAARARLRPGGADRPAAAAHLGLPVRRRSSSAPGRRSPSSTSTGRAGDQRRRRVPLRPRPGPPADGATIARSRAAGSCSSTTSSRPARRSRACAAPLLAAGAIGVSRDHRRPRAVTSRAGRAAGATADRPEARGGDLRH